MWHFHYMVLFAAHRRFCLRMLAEDAWRRRMRRSRYLLFSTADTLLKIGYCNGGGGLSSAVEVGVMEEGRDDVDTCPEELSFQKPRGNIKAFLPYSLKPQSVADRGRSISRERKSSNFEHSPPVLCDLAKENKVLSSEMCSKNSKPSSKFVASTSSEESSSSDRTMDDSEFVVVLVEPNPKAIVDTSSLFDVLSREGNELNKVLGELGTSSSLVRRPKVKRTVPPSEQITLVQTSQVGVEGVNANVNMALPLKKQKQESGKDIRASSKGVGLKAVEQEALDLAKRDPILLDTQIRSSISQLSFTWKSAAEVLKVAATDRAEYEAEKVSLAKQLKERTALCEQLQKEKKDQFEKKVAATKKEVEDKAKKAVDIVVASRNKLIQAFYFWGLSREDVDLALAGKYSEIIFPGDDASPVAEQCPTPPVADDTTKEEVVRLRGKVIELEKALSRAKDSINRTQQVHNKLEYERRLHKSNFDNTFKELFKLQYRYGKIKIERNEVLRKGSDRFALFQKSLKNKQLADESDKLECHRSLLSLTLHFEAEVDSERGLKEAYLELLTERGIVPDPARVKFLAQEAHNRHSIEAQRCSAWAGVSIIWSGVGPLPDELDFYTQKRLRVSQSRFKKKITPKRGKRAINTDHERQIADVIAFYGGELERVENEFRCYISSCGKDVEVENDKAEDDEYDELVVLSASNNELSAKLQQCLLVVENTTLSNSKLESDMMELQSRLNVVTVELSCKDAEILTANNKAELWKESLK
ncbi:hypothetical protein GIB67_039681 [Kingdonia uniflora]|uniref:Uncharacterized protein n=1 Tax=Kingdonia uniflora TaxID=39325 RepID=A0A7J7MQ47_9MAGN|nr:hypothetical protein GIB67_039681 [Kingdonia uniflora]